MKLSTLMVINAVVALVFGLAFVLMPGRVVSYYAVTLNEGGLFVGQLFGAALIGFAVLTWLARNSGANEARQAILLALFVSDAVGFVVALLAQLAGVANSLGWSTVAIYLLLALGFGYFRFMRSGA